jgi:acetyltransferase-like isoleucine patch superfamily enzyme
VNASIPPSNNEPRTVDAMSVGDLAVDAGSDVASVKKNSLSGKLLRLPIVARAKSKWDRDANAPLSSRLRKAQRYASGSANAKRVLRSVDLVGVSPRVNGSVRIDNEGTMELGDDVVLRGVPSPLELVTGPHGVLRIGHGVFINSGSSICAHGSITIGDRTLIGPDVMIIDTSFHEVYARHREPAPRPIVLEDDVWIGAKVSILPGVRIGRGSIVAANSLVNEDVAPFTIVRGVPAVHVGTLDPKKFEWPAGVVGPVVASANGESASSGESS